MLANRSFNRVPCGEGPCVLCLAQVFSPNGEHWTDADVVALAGDMHKAFRQQRQSSARAECKPDGGAR